MRSARVADWNPSFFLLRCDSRPSTVSAADLPPLPMLISPFLALIRSPLTTGPITSQALAALLSLLSIFPSELPAGNEAAELELTQALSDISSAVTHCKFEASDSQGDEVVLLKILEVLDVLVKRWGGRDGRTLLGDREVCEMLETGLGMCCQMRLSGAFSLVVSGSLPGFDGLTYLSIESACRAPAQNGREHSSNDGAHRI